MCVRPCGLCLVAFPSSPFLPGREDECTRERESRNPTLNPFLPLQPRPPSSSTNLLDLFHPPPKQENGKRKHGQKFIPLKLIFFPSLLQPLCLPTNLIIDCETCSLPSSSPPLDLVGLSLTRPPSCLHIVEPCIPSSPLFPHFDQRLLPLPPAEPWSAPPPLWLSQSSLSFRRTSSRFRPRKSFQPLAIIREHGLRPRDDTLRGGRERIRRTTAKEKRACSRLRVASIVTVLIAHKPPSPV